MFGCHFTVNGFLDHDNKKSGRVAKIPNLWTGKLGPGKSLKDLFDFYDGTIDKLPEGFCLA